MSNGLVWTIWVTLGFFCVYTINWFSPVCTRIEYLQFTYILILSLPLWVPKLVQWIKTRK